MNSGAVVVLWSSWVSMPSSYESNNTGVDTQAVRVMMLSSGPRIALLRVSFIPYVLDSTLNPTTTPRVLTLNARRLSLTSPYSDMAATYNAINRMDTTLMLPNSQYERTWNNL